MADGVFTILWRQITSSQIPFPSSDALTGTNLASGTVINQTVGRYLNNPLFAGITISTTGSGGNARMQICFGPEQQGKKVKLYITFSNTVYEFEVQVWAPGCWTIQNPGSGPSTPNSIFFGNPVNIFDDFEPGESDPAHPPPTYNPFIPDLLITIESGTSECTLVDIIKVTINQIPTVAIAGATVYKDGQPTGITLADLLAGVTFADPGNYEISIIYQYLGDGTSQNPAGPPGQVLTQEFTISSIPFPHMQRQSRVYGYVVPGEAMLFDDTLIDDGTIEYNEIDGAFTLRFCGDYFIKWFIASEMGFTTDGSDFAIAINGTTDLIGSSHTKISPTVGFSIVKVTGLPPTVQLVSVADGIIELSKVTQVKAGIVIFKIGDETSASKMQSHLMKGES
ncbi:MAG: hypothetical protein FWF85_01885 [Clostridiales bacterium]|nr:hypothetical protein [Clostridiales bacterium]